MNNAAVADFNVTEFHLKKFGKFYEPKILEPAAHIKLVEDIQHVAETANVPAQFIYRTHLSDYCGEAEAGWVKSMRKYKAEGMAGFAYFGGWQSVEDRMMAMAGAFIRNYIDARIMTVQDILERLKANDMPEPSVLLIPNFFVGKSGGGNLPEWQVTLLYGWLLKRFTKNKQTVLYVSDAAQMTTQYGGRFTEHIASHYVVANQKKMTN